MPEDGIGERIKERRKELDLSVEELSALTARYDYEMAKGVSPASIYRYEKVGEDGSLPGARELRLLCDALNVPPNWLLIGGEWDKGGEEAARLVGVLRDILKSVIEPQQQGDGTWRGLEHASKLFDVKGGRGKPSV